MQVDLIRTSPLNYTCSNQAGHKIALSGDKQAVGPMESVLMASAGCSVIDIELILQKMRQNLKDIKAQVTGIRAEENPKVFTHIHVHYVLYGDIKEEKALHAVALSVDEYCSVFAMLNKTAEIKTTFEIISENEI